ncbi:NADH:flavin oxidoreductase/NADH oxidase [Devosia naphthalenivorans]|uniref:NADH:flavin oxidoreductase/NADH oxidase n=1 Tax=Devosia naphthalenivorans TaxID=2082392 RepID=UPI000D3BEEC7|nr:NADH:flavin oxidoreductase/NADH oxidase [Devosia naphthalenivorans]
MSQLFSPFELAGITFPNRIVVSPMCQHMANDGQPSDWHLMHWGHLALSGAALIMIESTAVEANGRIGPHCLGLYSDETAHQLGNVLDRVRKYGDARFGVQLSHAGRKGSSVRGRVALREGGWRTYAPSAIAVGPDWPVPADCTMQDLKRIRHSFAAAARRAEEIGLDVVELHAAHGYLLHQFLSPLTNRREDSFGGSAKKRMRFPLDVFQAVREVWPTSRPLGVRISGSDWIEGGASIEDAIAFATELKVIGCDFVDVSSGGIATGSRPPQVTSSYQVPFAAAVRTAVGIPTWAVGMIVSPHQAEEILAQRASDFICLGRAILDDPRWPWHAAEAMGISIPYPEPYSRSHFSVWPGAHERWKGGLKSGETVRPA